MPIEKELCLAVKQGLWGDNSKVFTEYITVHTPYKLPYSVPPYSMYILTYVRGTTYRVLLLRTGCAFNPSVAKPTLSEVR